MGVFDYFVHTRFILSKTNMKGLALASGDLLFGWLECVETELGEI